MNNELRIMNCEVGQGGQTFVNGRKQIRPEAAIKFGVALGSSAVFWMNLEVNYRLHRAVRESDEAQLAAIRSRSELVPTKT
jgi:plasmid maintenance system antidote protein VapI